jgi:hypothetical protein
MGGMDGMNGILFIISNLACRSQTSDGRHERLKMLIMQLPVG